MKKRYLYIALCLVISLLQSCSDRDENVVGPESPAIDSPSQKEDPENGSEENEDENIDGAWEAMKWEAGNINGNVSVKYSSDALVEFNISGEGSIEMTCQNYSPWVSFGTNLTGMPEDIKEFNYEWLHVSISDNVVYCNFDSLPEDFHKEIFVNLTGGDIFCTLLFVREEDFGPSGKWAPISWELQNLKGDVELEYYKNRTTVVVEGECSFDLVCTDYDDIWFTPGLFTPDPVDIHQVDIYWAHLTIKGNIIHFELDPWNGDEEEFKNNPDWQGETPYMDLDVSAGEISNKLEIYQKFLLKK